MSRRRRDDGEAPLIIDRREMMKLGAAGVGATVIGRAATGRGRVSPQLPSPELGSPPERPLAAAPLETVRAGYVGVGGMGSSHCRNLLQIEGARIVAVCDIVAEKAERIRDWVVDAGFPAPTLYTRGDWDFVRLCAEEDLDLVYTATPWRWHVPVCVAAMENDKHAATEVPAAYTIADCWKLVEYAERYEKHCIMMENCNYDRPEMMVYNMVRQGVFGEILHAECGYLHDLRQIKFADEGEGLWRREHSKVRNGNLYPTHGLGPVANCMEINRGDRFDYLVSMSGPSRGLQLYAAANFLAGDSTRSDDYVLGDVNTALIRTVRGRTIYLVHDTNLPRPYSRIHKVQGTKGLYHGYPDRVSIEGFGRPHSWIDDEGYEWEGERYDLDRVRRAYDHPLWRQLDEMSQGAGHGGMDFIEDYRLIKCLREGTATDMNVYDAATLSAVCELTEISVANRSIPIEFPDFTRGRWQSWEPLDIVGA